MRAISGILVLLLTGIQLLAAPTVILRQFYTATPRELDGLRLSGCTLDEFVKMTFFSLHLKASDQVSMVFKGDVGLSVVFGGFSEKVTAGEFDRRNPCVSYLLSLYETQQYYCPGKKPNDFLKLAHHFGQGNYGYIYSRFKVSPFFFPTTAALFAFIIFALANLTGLLKWQLREKTNILILTLSVLSILLFIAFKLTYEQYVTTDSFYGLRF